MGIELTSLDQQEILRYLGCREMEPPEELRREVSRCSRMLLDVVRPKTVWRLLDLEGTHLTGTAVNLLGEDIQRHLSECSQVILMAATLGPETEQLLLRVQVRDMAQALILDSCASAAVEAVCDQLESELRQRFLEAGRYLTDRFSPGYGDFPIEQQPDLCGLLDTQRRIGLTLSASGILIPRKSVTAVLGVADSPRHQRSHGCQGCAMYEHCEMRKGGNPCGG
ncbi:MAG: vitamin B12 dependent-methionine synthase activation domain-containing protein [Candidatus Onthomonas sp.]